MPCKINLTGTSIASATATYWAASALLWGLPERRMDFTTGDCWEIKRNRGNNMKSQSRERVIHSIEIRKSQVYSPGAK